MTALLTSTDCLPATAAVPGYDRRRVKSGILHIGPGAFFRAHIALFTDEALAAAGGDWGIETGGLRNGETAGILNAQNGLYTLLVRETETTRARVVGSILAAHPPSMLLARLFDPAIRIATMTVTEKAYGIDPVSHGLDEQHPDIAADLANPEEPRSLVGLLVEALRLRRGRGHAPFTPLCCDNLPSNGALLRTLVLAFAARRDAELAAWIGETVPFPSTMVDRITPASTDATYRDAERLTGRRDRAAVEAEPFAQWVIEDDFAAGRPAWEKAGALMVASVSPYEKMKLRMLNGTHSLSAYLGVVAGHEFMRDVMADADLAALAREHLATAAATLDPVPGIDLKHYARDLMDRFANRAIAHRTRQIAMDGTQKLPQRIFEPAVEALRSGGRWESFAAATAAWMRYTLGSDRRGAAYDLLDPREKEIRAALAGGALEGKAVAERLHGLPGLFPAALVHNPLWTEAVAQKLDRLLQADAPGAIGRAT